MYKYTVCIHGVYTENILYVTYAESVYIYIYIYIKYENYTELFH